MRISVLILISALAAPIHAGAPKAARPGASPVSSSLEALLKESVSRLNARDTLWFNKSAFDSSEFMKVYPLFETDTSSARRAFACQYYLMDNRKLLERVLAREGGKRLKLIRYKVDGLLETYGSFTLYRGIRLWVKGGGEEIELRLIKSAALWHGQWKIWSFVDD